MRVRYAVGAGALAVMVAASGWAWWARHDSDPRYGLRAAERASGPACTGLAGRWPGRLDGHRRERVDVTGAEAWGAGAVTARCGVTSPGPSADPCVSVNGVDWLLEQARSRQAGRKVLVSYGRSPAVEVTVSPGVRAVDTVLLDLSKAVAPMAQRSHCV
ncbi:hypothetical protein J2Z21_004255 [Streptomyces griseochromogenes]|uniref:DUF3515 domain-containing protein n=1 Tax=Streptomyces griseochromogenes TaxID=68214 RepID=A0A1B1AVB8_9ACTN|nr:DUF3515 family protein [Streptomyces griseochromogenes]ANP50524.1 hypothetical protein AVL59_13635 [Streptomyces griseochromogenes]MBP2051284.1 hypothetical protein [Streptomyces griseochromogenes]